jgi:hypothetical protein
MSALHDITPGPVKACQLCGSDHLRLVLDLGHQAPCDSLLTPAQLDAAEQTWPLRLMRCEACGLVQLDHAVAPEILFHRDYPYRSGITATLRNNLRATAAAIIRRFAIPPGSLAVDLGSNDGTLLSGFRDAGMRVLGVEPTNIAQIARADGIDTWQEFFTETTGRRVRDDRGPVAVVTAANMFAHVAQLGSLLRGVDAMLAPDGVFVTESHYLGDIIATVQYDSVYHEHLKYYSLRTIADLLGRYGFGVVDVDRIENYGGSIRVFAMRGRDRRPSDAVAALLAEEDAGGLNTAAPLLRFSAQAQAARRKLQRAILDEADAGRVVPGIGCPGRAATLVNFSGLDRDAVPYIAEQSSSLKLGLHLPGAHIPVVDEARLLAEQPRRALMLSWHYWRPILRNLRAKGLRSEIIVPLPGLHVVHADG